MGQYRDFDDVLGELETKEYPKTGKIKQTKILKMKSVDDSILAKPKVKRPRGNKNWLNGFTMKNKLKGD